MNGKKGICIWLNPEQYEILNDALLEEIKSNKKPVSMAAFITAKVLKLFKVKGGK